MKRALAAVVAALCVLLTTVVVWAQPAAAVPRAVARTAPAWPVWGPYAQKTRARVDGCYADDKAGKLDGRGAVRTQAQVGPSRHVTVRVRSIADDVVTPASDWTYPAWEPIEPGQRRLLTGPDVACYPRFSEISAVVHTKKRKVWGEPQELVSMTLSGYSVCGY